MLQINMADVMNVIGSLTPYLIAIGVLFVLALIITFAVNKKTVKEVAPVRSSTPSLGLWLWSALSSRFP